MLSYSEFQPIQGYRRGFKFKKMMPIDQQMGIYADATTKKRFFVTVITSQQHFTMFQNLCKKEIFGNIVGLFKRKNQYYCFSLFDGYETLSEFIEQHRGEKELISQLFCLQLIEQVIQIAKKIEGNGNYLKILSPFCIMLTLTKNSQYRFQLKFPLPHHLFEELTVAVAQRQIQFCAPEIMISMDHQQDLNRNKFNKSVLYSLGLVLLYCFGYRIKSQERILALKKNKQFKIFLKAIRKEIKLFQQGKFICKIIKIVMQQNEYVRDNIDTFLIKLRSPQLQSLRKFVFKPPPQTQKQTYIPTIYSDYSDQIRRSGLDRTIQIRLSSVSNCQNCSQNKSDREVQQNVTNGQYNFALFSTFKKQKLPETYKYHPQIKEEEQDQREQELKIEVPSPIEIHLDWDDEDQQNSIVNSPKKNLEQSQKNNKQCYDFPQDDLQITVKNVDLQKSKNRQRFLYSEGRSCKNNAENLKRSLKSSDGNYKMRQISEMNEIQSKVQLKTEIKEFKDETQVFCKPNNNQKYHVMVEQDEPEIIKYSQKEYKLGPSPRFNKRKTLKSSNNDLQDMTLIQEDPDDEQEFQQIEEKNQTHYEELKTEFNKKSQAIFIILLVNFLIYKVIDYFVQ